MAKKRLKIDQLAKLRQFTTGMDVEKYLSSEFRQLIRALEQGYIQTDEVDPTSIYNAGINKKESGDCGGFSTASGLAVDVTNLSVQITTTGKKVWIGLVWSGVAGNNSSLQTDAAGTVASADYYILRDSTEISRQSLVTQIGAATSALIRVPGSILYCVEHDLPAGTYTYKVQAKSITGTARVSHSKLQVYEF